MPTNDETAPQQVSHQTVKLQKGRHSSPRQGVCVIELASMLAGEPFTDHPVSASMVIRRYSDHEATLKLVDELVGLGDGAAAAVPPEVGHEVMTRSQLTQRTSDVPLRSTGSSKIQKSRSITSTATL